MSYIYLQEQGGESSAECFSDIPAYVLSRLNLIAEKSFYKDKETESFQSSQSGTMCEHLMENRGEEKSTSFAADSPVKTYLAQGKERELKESEADCGLNLQESLAKYDPATHLWRTRQCSLFEGLGECLETFPKSGMMQGGVLWELTMWEHRTSERECGFWRTPDTGVGKEISESKARDYANKTPRASGRQIQIRLCDQVKYPMLWPTPKCQDSRAALIDRHKSNLGEVIHGRYLNGGDTTPQTTKARLNPNWVEWLMGWPINYTNLNRQRNNEIKFWKKSCTAYLQGETMSNMWFSGDPAETPHRQESQQQSGGEYNDSLPKLPQSGAYENGRLGKGEGQDCDMQNLRKGIPTQTNTQKCNMQQGMPEREWQEERAKAMGFIPRISVGVQNRVDRLKAIGNGQVPLVAATAFKLLKGNGDER